MRRHSLVLLALVAACGGGVADGTSPTAPAATPTPNQPSGSSSSPTYDYDAKGAPRFVASPHIPLAVLDRISTFRSSFGHDYHDAFESCRSMKHYFMPRAELDWSKIPVSSPVSGWISHTENETTFGTQVRIRSSEQPAFTFILFHVNPTMRLDSGTVVQAGQQIGTHIGNQTDSDVAVGIDTPAGYRLVSWFDVITDDLFAQYRARGIASRDAAILTKAARDADPITCNGETFVNTGSLPTWMVLQ